MSSAPSPQPHSPRRRLIDLPLLPSQEPFVFSRAQFPAFIGGFGSGKTHALVTRAILGKLRYPRLNRAYFAPTFDLIAQTAWPRFEAQLTAFGLPYRLEKSARTISVANHGKFIFRSLEVPERIVGFEAADCDVDELDTLPSGKAKEAWNRVISRARQVKPDGAINTVAAAGTPEGFAFLYDRWGKNANDRYCRYQGRTRDNPMLPPGYIEGLRATYAPQLLAAYLDGEFVNLTSGAVYPNFNRLLNRSTAQAIVGEPLHVGMDFNVYNMTAIVFVLREGAPHAVEELTGVRDTESMAAVIAERFRSGPNEGRSITIYPDATGASRKTVNAQVSDIAILTGHKFRVFAHKANPPVKDRVNAMNAMILNAKGERRLFVNVERCPYFVECLEKQAFDDNGEPDKHNDLDHGADAGGYFIAYKYPIVRPSVGIIDIGFAY